MNHTPAGNGQNSSFSSCVPTKAMGALAHLKTQFPWTHLAQQVGKAVPHCPAVTWEPTLCISLAEDEVTRHFRSKEKWADLCLPSSSTPDDSVCCPDLDTAAWTSSQGVIPIKPQHYFWIPLSCFLMGSPPHCPSSQLGHIQMLMQQKGNPVS